MNSMKKILFLVLFLFWFPVKVEAISAESYVVMDYDSGRFLMSQNATREKLIASTTKIMTAIIALENGDIGESLIDKMAFRVLAWKYYKGLMYDVLK